MRGGPIRACPALAALLVASCGVGGVLSGSGGGGGGGAAKPKRPPALATVSAAGSDGNFVRLQVTLSDPEADGAASDPRVRIFPEWALASDAPAQRTWIAMTEAALEATGGTRGLPLGVHEFVWAASFDLGTFSPTVSVRVRAEYEEAAGRRHTFRSNEVEVRLDNAPVATILGGAADAPADVPTLPVDLRADGDSFLVAALGANTVERIDSAGQVTRVVGLGFPGAELPGAASPGNVRLPGVAGLEITARGDVLTAHARSIVLTNAAADPAFVGAASVAPRTVAAVVGGLSGVRAIRRHPSGAWLWIGAPGGVARVVAFHPGDASGGTSAPIELGGIVLAPGETATVAGGGTGAPDGRSALDADLSHATRLAVGPDGEVYVAERERGRLSVVNLGTADLVLPDVVVAPGAADRVAGRSEPTASGDRGPARSAGLGLVEGIDVLPPRSVLVVDTGIERVRLVNLGRDDVAFGNVTVAPGVIHSVIGGDVGAVGSAADRIQASDARAIAVDAAGAVLFSRGTEVILVNPGADTVERYGQRVGPGRTALVHDTSRRGGLPLQGPRAAHVSSAQGADVFLTDRTTVRAINFGTEPVSYGGVVVERARSEVIGGGSVPGFAGDGGPARGAAFREPSAVATFNFRGLPPSLTPLLFVADTGNDRVRAIHLGTPGAAPPLDALGTTIGAGHVDTVVGGGEPAGSDHGDGGAPRDCSLSRPEGLWGARIGGDDLLIVSDTGHHRIRVVNPASAPVRFGDVVVEPGTIRTIVGDGAAGFTADGPGPWRIDSPTAVAENAGLLYFCDTGNARIRVVNFTDAPVRVARIDVPPGEMRTLVGTGVRGFEGDGDFGPRANVHEPRAMFLQTRTGEPNALFFSDAGQNVVRMLNLTNGVSRDDDLKVSAAAGQERVAAPGTVVAIAGGPNRPGFTNPPAFVGDGLLPTEARFARPRGVVWMTEPSGDLRPAHFLVADEGNDRLRRFYAPPTRKPFTAP